MIAEDIDALHSEDNNISKQTALSEQGEEIAGRGDEPNRHDILTGSNPDGTAIADMTCNDWTSNGEGQAMVGHHDRVGLRDDAPSRSWNSSHPSRVQSGKLAVDRRRRAILLLRGERVAA